MLAFHQLSSFFLCMCVCLCRRVSMCYAAPWLASKSRFWQIIHRRGGWQAKWGLSERLTKAQGGKIFEKKGRKEAGSRSPSVYGTILEYLNSSPHLHLAHLIIALPPLHRFPSTFRAPRILHLDLFAFHQVSIEK